MKSVSNWALSFFSDEFSRRDGYFWAPAISLVLILLFHFLLSCKFRFFTSASSPSSSHNVAVSHAESRISRLVSDEDLKCLIENLGETNDAAEIWENVIHKSNDRISYTAKRCKPKDGGPMKYLSVTVFEDCSAEILKDFYMDNDYRKLWDKTVVEHDQLHVERNSGIEIGRTIKKFPLLTSREYVLAWRLWQQGNDNFYCFTKECDHSMVPRERKYVRVSYYRSGWRIRQVPGRNACEIKMFHQENAGLNVEMAKLAFSKGVWSYVCKMENALCKYIATSDRAQGTILSAVTLIKKVPSKLEETEIDDVTDSMGTSSGGGEGLLLSQDVVMKQKKLLRKPSKKLIAKGMVLVGGAICLSRGHSSLGAKVALAYLLTKLNKRGTPLNQNTSI